MTDFRTIPLGNDFAFAEVMRDAETCQYFLEAVLNLKIRHIEYIDKQKDLSDSYDAHGIRLDVYVEDDAGIVYNVEVQNRRESFKRIRYYQSGMDRRLLEKGDGYRNLRRTYIIFVCNYDPAGKGYPLYRRECVLTSPAGNTEYDDESYCIFLNAKYREEYRSAMPEVCEFLDLIGQNREIDEADYETRLGQKAAAGLRILRKDEQRRIAYMTFEQKLKDEAYYAREEGLKEGLEKGRAEGLAEGKAEGRAEGKAEGLAEGEAKGVKKGAIEMRDSLIRKLMEVQSLTREEAERILS